MKVQNLLFLPNKKEILEITRLNYNSRIRRPFEIWRVFLVLLCKKGGGGGRGGKNTKINILDHTGTRVKKHRRSSNIQYDYNLKLSVSFPEDQ